MKFFHGLILLLNFICSLIKIENIAFHHSAFFKAYDDHNIDYACKVVNNSATNSKHLK